MDRCPLATLGEVLIVRIGFLILTLGIFGGVHAEVYLTEGTNISVDVAGDGRAAIDLLGGIWIIPADGGDAKALQNGSRPARRPFQLKACRRSSATRRWLAG